MAEIYSITDWDRLFENHESRKLKKLLWVPFPNRFDGLAYRRLTQHKKSTDIFAAFILMVEVASRMPKRGVLADEKGPLSADDLSAMTGFKSEIFTDAVEYLSSPKIGWICKNSPILPESPDLPGESPDATPEISRDPLDIGRKEGKEKKERKHAFQDSGFYPFQQFRESLPEWSDEKCKYWFREAEDYSTINGGRYLDWRGAVIKWDRKREFEKEKKRSSQGALT